MFLFPYTLNQIFILDFSFIEYHITRYSSTSNLKTKKTKYDRKF